ncbi:MAG: DNA gyrase subunit A [Leptospirales bacterium]|nr:DNA gyrase subunit A [Leptospirales bacterium]
MAKKKAIKKADSAPRGAKAGPSRSGNEAHLTQIVRTDIQGALARGQRVVPVDIENQMKEAYLDYAMSVIVGRALPDVRDGLKPVHRRILFAMHEKAWRQDRAFVKCAKIVGEVIGNFHPHGDGAVYDTLVRMAQDWTMRAPLIDGQGNFGSIDGDPPAAYRYTEARLTKMAEELLRDIDKETVNYNPNFDATRKEPVVLPAAFPNLLVNGASGIAVGMATNIPPHNLQEVIAATKALIENPKLSAEQLLKYIPAPDFPTGGIIIGGEGLKAAYTTGRGQFRIRARVEIEQTSRGRDLIVITEIPYQVNKKTLLEKIGELIQNKAVEGIADIRDLSDRHGIRVEIELKKEASAQIILNQLYKQTQLQVSYGVILLALVGGQPRVLNVKDILTEYIAHRREVVIRRTTYELAQAEKRAHILEGLKIALDFIDEVIKIIRGSKTVDEAREKLIKRFKLTEIQANAILDMRLQKLTSLESQKIIEELNQLKEQIKDYKSILKSEERQYKIVSDELGEVGKQYPGKRATEIDHSSVDTTNFEVTDLIADEDCVITISEDGFVKRMAVDSFRRQRRGGRGVKGGSGAKREDYVKRMLVASTHDTLLLFSNKGKVFALKVHELPDSTREARGKSLKALINLAQDEKISALAATREFGQDRAIVMITRQGILKKCDLEIFQNTRKGGIIALNLRKEDELIDVRLVGPRDDIIVASRLGNALRTNLAKMRSQGRNAAGIIGMRLEKEDYVIGMDMVRPKTQLLVISERGFGKRVPFNNFPAKGRGGKGMTYIKITEKNGPAVRICSVLDDDDIVIMTTSGMTLRMVASEVSSIGRATVGVKLVNLADSDAVRDVAIMSDE